MNYMEVVDLLHSPCEEHKKSHPHELVHGVRVRDKQTDEEFDIHAAMTVNATGPFVDSILKMYTRLEDGENALKTSFRRKECISCFEARSVRKRRAL